MDDSQLIYILITGLSSFGAGFVVAMYTWGRHRVLTLKPPHPTARSDPPPLASSHPDPHPAVAAVLEGGYPEAYQVVVEGQNNYAVVESTNDVAEVKDGLTTYREAGYHAGIVAAGVFRG